MKLKNVSECIFCSCSFPKFKRIFLLLSFYLFVSLFAVNIGFLYVTALAVLELALSLRLD